MKKRLIVSLTAVLAAYTLLISDGLTEPLPSPRANERDRICPSFSAASIAWTQPVRISSPETDSRHPVLVADHVTGRIHLTWEEDSRTIRYAYRDPGGPDWRIEPHAWLGHRPAIALDPDGFPHIVYVYASDAHPQESQIFHRSPRQDWVPSSVSSTIGNSQRPDIGLIIGQDVHVVWVETLDGTDTVYHARSQDQGLTWLEMEPISGGSAPALAVGPGGLVWVAWQRDSQLSGDERADIFASSRGTEGWSEPVDVSLTPAGDSRSPDIACDSGGNAHVAWEEEAADGLSSAVRYVLGTPEGWTAPESLSSGSGFATAPYVTIGADDSVYVAWDAGTSVGMCVRPSGDLWETPELIASNEMGIRDVTIAIGAEGGVHAAWSARADEGEWAVYYRERAPEATPTETPTDTPTPSPTATTPATETPSPSPTLTHTLAPTVPTIDPTLPSETLVPSPTRTGTLAPTVTPSPTATPTDPATPVATLPTRLTGTATTSPTLTNTVPTEPTQTPTSTGAPVATETPTPADTLVPPTGTLTPVPTLPSRPQIFFPGILSPADGGPVIMSPGRGGARAPRDPPPRAEPTVPAWAWSSVTNVSSPTGPGSSLDSGAATMAVAANGDVYAVWVEQLPSGHPILCSGVRSGDGWTEPTCFFIGEEPDMVATSSGIHLVYSNEFQGKYDIYYIKWDGDGWTASQNVSYTSGTSSQPAIAVRDDGGLFVVWTDTTEGYSRIYYAWREGDVWNTYFVPSSVGGGAPDVAVGRNDRVWVSWQVLEASDHYDVYAISGDGVNWSPYAMNISNSPLTDSLAPKSLGLADSGAFIVWQENGGSGFETYYSDNLKYIDWWDKASNVSQTTGDSEQPSISGNGARSVFVAWDENDRLLLRRRQTATGAWSAAGTILVGEADIGEVELASGAGRRIHALWSHSPGSDDRDVYYRNGSLIMPYQVWMSLVASS